jgi:hypothetical protein
MRGSIGHPRSRADHTRGQRRSRRTTWVRGFTPDSPQQCADPWDARGSVGALRGAVNGSPTAGADRPLPRAWQKGSVGQVGQDVPGEEVAFGGVRVAGQDERLKAEVGVAA